MVFPLRRSSDLRSEFFTVFRRDIFLGSCGRKPRYIHDFMSRSFLKYLLKILYCLRNISANGILSVFTKQDRGHLHLSTVVLDA